VVVQVEAVKIYAAAVVALRKKENRMKLSLPPKLIKNINPIFFCKIFIPSYAFDALLCFTKRLKWWWYTKK
jgi:hypothetical protein